VVIKNLDLSVIMNYKKKSTEVLSI